MKYIKLNKGEMMKATLKDKTPVAEQGKFGIQHNYFFQKGGEDYVLTLSPNSPANNKIQMLNNGDNVVIRKLDLGGGKTTWDVTIEGDISVLPQNQNLPSGKESFKRYVESPANEYGYPTGQTIGMPTGMPSQEEIYADKERERQVSIEMQSSIRSAAIFLAPRLDAKSEDVMEIAEKLYVFLQSKK